MSRLDPPGEVVGVSRTTPAVLCSLGTALVCAVLATPLGSGSYWASESEIDYATVWLNGLLMLGSGLTCLAMATLPARRRRTPWRSGLLVVAGCCGVLLFVENALEDAWHQHWAAWAFDVILPAFLLSLLAATTLLLVVPGGRWLGVGLLLAIVCPGGGALLGFSGDRGQALALMGGFVALAACVVTLGRTESAPHSPIIGSSA